MALYSYGLRRLGGAVGHGIAERFVVRSERRLVLDFMRGAADGRIDGRDWLGVVVLVECADRRQAHDRELEVARCLRQDFFYFFRVRTPQRQG